MSKAIVVTSGKGGVGKTTVVTHLAYSLSQLNKRVVALDLDFGLSNLDVAFGVEEKIVYTASDVIEGRCRVKQALVECDKNLYMIASSSAFKSEISGQNVKLLIEGLKSNFDYVLIDCPAGIDFGFRRAVSCADGVILVVNPSLQSIRDGDRVLSLIDGYKIKDIRCVVNRVRVDLIKKKKQLSPKDVEGVLKLNVIAGIPDDDNVLLCNNYVLNRNSLSNKAFKEFAKRLISVGAK